MSKVDYNEMTNKQLQELVDDFELKVDSKIAGRPTKAELVATLEAYKKEQDIINGVEEEDEIEDSNENDELDSDEGVEASKKIVKQKDLPKEKKRALQRADLLRKVRVMVFDKQNTQTRIPVITVTWGNKLVGINTDIVNLQSGKAQYVRRGALANLESATFSYSYQDDESDQVRTITEKRFEIRELDGLSEEEIETLAQQQKMNKRLSAM